MEINPNEVYTTEEMQRLLKISNSTIKRLIKNGIIRANKIGGRYRILGKEVLRAVSPKLEEEAVGVYQHLKKKIKDNIRNW